MKDLIIISALAFCILSTASGAALGATSPTTNTTTTRYIHIQAPDGSTHTIDLWARPITKTAQPEDISLHLFTRLGDATGIPFNLGDFNGDLTDTGFDPSLPTYFFIHGWIVGHQSLLALPHHILNHDYGKEANVFLVDYKPISGLFYTYAVGGLRSVGGIIAVAIEKISLTNGISIGDINVIGFSLGAHLAGFIGATLKGQLKKIIALDPAGPLFDAAAPEDKLDPSDAQFVQVIHTNGGLMGHRPSLGHVDFFPNGGGMNQPGCGIDLFGSCAHDRAYSYYQESMESNRFVARKCSNYKDYKAGLCNDGETLIMGTLTPDTSAFGNYYLDTSGEAPFALG